MKGFIVLLYCCFCITSWANPFNAMPEAHQFQWRDVPVNIELHGSAELQRENVHEALNRSFSVCATLMGELELAQVIRAPLTISVHSADVTQGGTSCPGHWGTDLFRQVFSWWADCRDIHMEPWLKEGLSSYYAWKTGIEAGWLFETSAEAYITHFTDAYYSHPMAGTISPLDADTIIINKDKKLLEGSGYLAILAIDMSLREDGERSLDQTLQVLFREASPKDILGVSKLQTTLLTIAGKNFGSFFDRHIRGVAFMPVKKYLAKAGFQMQLDTVAGLTKVTAL